MLLSPPPPPGDAGREREGETKLVQNIEGGGDEARSELTNSDLANTLFDININIIYHATLTLICSWDRFVGEQTLFDYFLVSPKTQQRLTVVLGIVGSIHLGACGAFLLKVPSGSASLSSSPSPASSSPFSSSPPPPPCFLPLSHSLSLTLSSLSTERDESDCAALVLVLLRVEEESL